MDVREAIRNMVGNNGAFGIICTVKSVSGNTCVCSPINDDADIEDVRLQAQAGNGVLLIPTVDSVVVVQMINDVEGVVIMYSDVESIKFLDGSFGGIVKVIELVSKLNNLENKVNDIIAAFNSHVHTGVSTGGGSSGTTPSTVSGTLTPTDRDDIENTSIEHGTT